MTKQQLINNFKTLLTINPPLAEIERLFLKAVQSGALRYGEEEEDSYKTAKIIYHAILSSMADTWLPIVKENRDEAKNLKIFL